MRKQLSLALLATILILTTACALPASISQQVNKTKVTPTAVEQGATDNPEPDQETPDKTAVSKSTEESPAEGAAPTDTVPPANEPTYLDNLDSYRLTFTLQAEGTNDAGAKTTHSLDVNQEAINTQKQFFINRKGDDVTLETGQDTETIYVNNEKTYVVNSNMTDQPCALFLTEGSNYLDFTTIFVVENVFPDIGRGDVVKEGEEVNGVVTTHYKLNSLDTSLGKPEKQSGDVWVAKDGDYIVKFTGEAEGTFDMAGAPAKGKMTWEYNLTDISKVTEIKMPDECKQQEQAIAEIPIPKDATNKDIQPGYIMFDSTMKPADLAKFYKDGFAAAGWKMTDETNDDPNFIITFEKEKRQMQVEIAMVDDTTSNVVITDISAAE